MAQMRYPCSCRRIMLWKSALYLQHFIKLMLISAMYHPNGNTPTYVVCSRMEKNWTLLIEWLGAKGTQVTFSGKISFPSKVPEFLHVLFSLVEKLSPVSFLGFNALGQLCCIHCALFDILSSVFSETKCKPAKKIQGECFTTSSKSTCKNSGTFEGKQICPKKATYLHLAPSHSIAAINSSRGVVMGFKGASFVFDVMIETL